MSLVPPAAVAAATALRKPAAHAEGEVVSRILRGAWPADSTLPPERDLAQQLGVTRPTLREALQRLDRDGWVQIRHGKPTRVRDIWREGGLNVLEAVVRAGGPFPPRFVSSLLEVRLAMAPAYAKAAVVANHQQVTALLAPERRPSGSPDQYAEFDWVLHNTLTVSSKNPVFTLILNGFGDFYITMARWYFQTPAARKASNVFYQQLFDAAKRRSAERAEAVTRAAMQKSLDLWQRTERMLERNGLVAP